MCRFAYYVFWTYENFARTYLPTFFIHENKIVNSSHETATRVLGLVIALFLFYDMTLKNHLVLQEKQGNIS